MKEKIENFIKYREGIKSELQEYVKDESIPLDERWKLFIESDLGEHQSWYFSSEVFELEKVYGEYEYDRKEYCEMNALIDRTSYYLFNQINKKISDRTSNEYKEKIFELDKIINDLKEDILKQFIKSFNFEW